MFEAVRNNKRIAQIILAILIIPFAFFGMDAYFSDSATTTEVAQVGGTGISVYDFDQALREQQDRLRTSAGGQVDRAQPLASARVDTARAHRAPQRTRSDQR